MGLKFVFLIPKLLCCLYNNAKKLTLFLVFFNLFYLLVYHFYRKYKSLGLIDIQYDIQISHSATQNIP
ncbi:hypothetical protein L1987_50367 [Smallanthus sonchifolius]|uniref:Uncharacterized protein n=1 Tax=Smallanthus sonchifolius TaxID=185202 RepID=A0ACB9EM50_9ASTR|nr:hypothetical protein L1987_50367 [Smallanthus sonchifolius]